MRLISKVSTLLQMSMMMLVVLLEVVPGLLVSQELVNSHAPLEGLLLHFDGLLGLPQSKEIKDILVGGMTHSSAPLLISTHSSTVYLCALIGTNSSALLPLCFIVRGWSWGYQPTTTMGSAVWVNCVAHMVSLSPTVNPVTLVD